MGNVSCGGYKSHYCEASTSTNWKRNIGSSSMTGIASISSWSFFTTFSLLCTCLALTRTTRTKRCAVGVHAEAVDEDHEMVDLCLDRHPLALVVQPLLLEHLLVRVVIALEVQQLLSFTASLHHHLVLDQHDVRADVVQEVPVVRHHHQRLVVRLQEVLQPDHRADVQVIRRLVQQQQVRRREQRRRQ